MRTTLNLDDDVAAQLQERAARERRSLSRVANDLVRAGLRGEGTGHRIDPYRPPILDTGRPLIDVTDIAATLELLDETSPLDSRAR